MFSPKIHLQSCFVFGPDIYANLIPDDHILSRINNCVDFSFVNEACRDLYSQNQGRPVKNLPETMFRSAIVQYMMDLSDREMEHAARFDIT
jgi:transposase, IS5 family